MGVATSPARTQTPPQAKKQDDPMAALRERCEKAEAEARFWEHVAELEAHPVRMRILRTLRDDLPTASPKVMSELFDVALGTVSYHANKLRAMKLVEVARRVPRRGAVEHFLRASKKARRR